MLRCILNTRILLVIGVTCLVQSAAQKCAYGDDKDVRTTPTPDLLCYHIPSFPTPNPGYNGSQLTSIYIEGDNISSISNSSLPPGLTSISLFGLPLTDIADDALDSFATTLESLTFAEAKFDKIPTTLLKLTGLTELHIMDTQIHHWVSDAPIQVTNPLKVIQLRNVSMSIWPTWISDFQSLVFVDLSINSLTNVPDNKTPGSEPDIFPSSLLTLGLSSNKLTVITENMFRNLYNLETIFLDNNPLSTISPLAFADLVSLHFLSMKETSLTEIPLAFASLGSIISIYWSLAQTVSCPCPASRELVEWLTSQTRIYNMHCTSGQDVDSYLRGQCQK